MSLSQVTTEIVTDPREYLTCIYGDAGVGKTTWCKQIPGHYFAICEVGTQGLEVFGHKIIAWSTQETDDEDRPMGFRQLIGELIQAKKDGWKDQREIQVLIIDTLDKLIDMLGVFLCQTTKFMDNGVLTKYDRISDVTWGKGYARIREYFIRAINHLMLQGFGVVLVSHVKERQIKWRGQAVTAYGLSLAGSIAEAIMSEVSALGYCGLELDTRKNEEGEIESIEQERFISWDGPFLRPAKHRLEQFPKTTPLKLDTGVEGELNGYKLYVAAFKEAAENASNITTERTNEINETEQTEVER